MCASAGGPADYSAITYARIREEHGVFWGGERLFADSFAHPDGRARFHAVAHRGPAEQPDADYPVHLTTGRVLAQYQSGAQTRRRVCSRRVVPWSCQRPRALPRR